MPDVEASDEFDREAEEQLLEDRRLLGRLLGETIRSQVGEAMLERIERIRQTAVRLRRGEAEADGLQDSAAIKADLEAQLDALDLEQTLHVVRAFSHFSLLANLAEDAHEHRRTAASAAAARPGSFAHALDRLGGASADALVGWFARARVSPVLTAHPTEVQRQSILDCEREIARLLAEPEGAERDEALHAEILRLWLTSMLRLAKLEAVDEVANGINYFRLTFLRELPRLYLEFEQALGQRFSLEELPWLPPFLTIGSWIGGDRDGNPNVTAAVLRSAQALHARLLFAHYLEETHLLGRELGLSSRQTTVPPEIEQLAERSGDSSPHRQDEPYRRAITGIYARLAATAQRLAGHAASPPPVADAAPYESPEGFAAELRIISDALKARRALGGGGNVAPAHQHVDRSAKLERGRERPGGHVAQGAAHDFRQKERRHVQITPASS